MKQNLTCFKCWKDTATLTYEENRIYKVSCECGCSYDFEHSSLKAAEGYHLKMLELYGEIDKNAALKTELSHSHKETAVLWKALDEARAEVERLRKEINENGTDWLSTALNEGDGAYRP